MRRAILILSLFLLATCYPYYAAQAQGYGQPPGYAPAAPPPPPPSYQGAAGSPYAGTRAPDPENCGTPDEPKPCPPMPRHPLPYYPDNRQ